MQSMLQSEPVLPILQQRQYGDNVSNSGAAAARHLQVQVASLLQSYMASRFSLYLHKL
jgi:hypothetical protein